MKDLNQMSLCQTLWARNKYLVLSHSSNIYLEIRQYLKSESVEVAHVQALIDQAVVLPENRGQVCNAFQHIWGYFKKKASMTEKEGFMHLLLRYQSGQADQKDLVAAVRDLLFKYPNPYLQKSTLLFQNEE
ncbi:YbgA family protein [Streptococcus gordonii]|uniref:YbgA family protein n=1 Tax=Streptococcus gordonii TaxID=1302 RepID=UPI0010EA74C6|nr:YbgA family protein [Streptococcus gordonii]VTS26045.1 Probable type II DNA modification enzyme [Streptococcus gordonii]